MTEIIVLIGCCGLGIVALIFGMGAVAGPRDRVTDGIFALFGAAMMVIAIAAARYL